MATQPEVFLDTSALFAAIWSASGGGRMILKLGEAEAIQLLVSSQVLTEMENVLRRKADKMLGALTLLLDRSGVKIVTAPPLEIVTASQSLITYAPDAQVLAAAWSAGCDYFVTLDRRHFLDDSAVADAVPFRMGTPGDFLKWYQDWLTETV